MTYGIDADPASGDTDSFRGIHRPQRAEGSKKDLALSRLIDELVVAFFVAMAVMWVVTAIAGLFG